MSKSRLILFLRATSLVLCVSPALVRAGGPGDLSVAAGTQAGSDEKATGGGDPLSKTGATSTGASDDKKQPTPEQAMQARFPQPTQVGHLLGLPVLDYDDATIGYVQQVVRTTDGKIRLIVPYKKRFGWARDWWPLNAGRRLVAVPIETVAILALQIDALDMTRNDFEAAPTWMAGSDQAIPPDQTIKIAVARR
jgi:hypothetical protein